jgi:hypothetical protein
MKIRILFGVFPTILIYIGIVVYSPVPKAGSPGRKLTLSLIFQILKIKHKIRYKKLKKE